MTISFMFLVPVLSCVAVYSEKSRKYPYALMGPLIISPYLKRAERGNSSAVDFAPTEICSYILEKQLFCIFSQKYPTLNYVITDCVLEENVQKSPWCVLL